MVLKVWSGQDLSHRSWGSIIKSKFLTLTVDLQIWTNIMTQLLCWLIYMWSINFEIIMVLKIWSGQDLSHRTWGSILKPKFLSLTFDLQSWTYIMTHPLVLVNINVKYKLWKNNGFQDMERTRFCYGRTDGRTDGTTDRRTDHYRATRLWRGPNNLSPIVRKKIIWHDKRGISFKWGWK